MTKASDNDYPSVLLTEQGSAPSSPAASHQRLYIRTSDHTLVTVNSSGTVTPVSSGSGAMATDALWDAAGDLAQGTGANTGAKLSAGTSGYVLMAAGAAAAVAWNEGPPGTIIGQTVNTAGNITVTSGSMADLPTNIAVTFTVPSTGNVLIELSATCAAAGTQHALMSWGVREGSSTIVTGDIVVRESDGSGTQHYIGGFKRFRITGLTPGASLTYKWAASASTTGAIISAGSGGPAIMTIVKAP